MYSLDKISKLKDGRFSFRYTCPKTQKIKTIWSKQTGDLIQRRKEIQKLQAAAPYSSIVSLKPFGMILDRCIDDKKNDVANGHLRQATLDGYNYDLDRLRPFRLAPITEDLGCINLVR